MGYTVVSQNNTTTTLQDENGNIVHVPAKTVLATSTEYEISEVNNSTATLTSSDGKVIRGIPCVAVLSGSEGGGGAVSSVNGQTGDVVITGNDVLPDQTGNSGKFLTTDGTDASWSDKPLVNTATGINGLTILGSSSSSVNTINIGASSVVLTPNGVAIGRESLVNGSYSLALGTGAKVGYPVGQGASQAIQLGEGTNLTRGSFQVKTYTMMNADGTIPAARHAVLPAADGTYTLQLVIADGVPTLSWVAV